MAARPGSVVEVRDAEGNLTEFEASTCAHCQKVTFIESRRKMTDVVDYCRACDRLICAGCAGKPCRPWEKEMERQEARAILFRDMARLAG